MAASPKCNSPELKIIQRHFSILVMSISCPEWLAAKLYSQGMISKEVCDEVTNTSGSSAHNRAIKLVVAVEDQIMANPSVLHEFLLVMRRDPSLAYIADDISDSFRKCSHELCVYVHMQLDLL